MDGGFVYGLTNTHQVVPNTLSSCSDLECVISNKIIESPEVSFVSFTTTEPTASSVWIIHKYDKRLYAVFISLAATLLILVLYLVALLAHLWKKYSIYK